MLIDPYKFAALMVGHRYYRLYINSVFVSGTAPSFIELRLSETAGGPSVTTGGASSQSGVPNPSFPVSNLFDGNISTWWANETTTPTWWVEYDFGAGIKHKIIEYALYFGGSSNYTPNYWLLQYSDDGSTWANADTVSLSSFPGPGWHTYTAAAP